MPARRSGPTASDHELLAAACALQPCNQLNIESDPAFIVCGHVHVRALLNLVPSARHRWVYFLGAGRGGRFSSGPSFKLCPCFLGFWFTILQSSRQTPRVCEPPTVRCTSSPWAQSGHTMRSLPCTGPWAAGRTLRRATKRRSRQSSGRGAHLPPRASAHPG